MTEIPMEVYHRVGETRSLPAEGSLEGRSSVLSKLRGVILLGGSIPSNSLQNAIGRSIVDIPITSGERLLDNWRGHCSALAGFLGETRLPVRVVVNVNAPVPVSLPRQN